MKIQFIFRKKSEGFNSIENVFRSITGLLSKENEISIWQLPFKNISFVNVWKNIFYCFKIRGFKHITGDTHYIAIVFPNSVLTIHDIHSSFGKNYLKNLIIKIFWYWLPALSVKYITTISTFSAKEIAQLIPFAKNKIRVIPNPVSKQFVPTPKEFDVNCPTILQIGTKPNKNLDRLIPALSGINCEFIIVGKLNAEQFNILAQYNINYKQYFNLEFTEIIRLYEQSDIVSFVSTYEGFGMPIIEAQAVGRPVLSSNYGAMLEVARDSAYLVDPFDTQSIRQGLLELIGNEEIRNSLILKGFDNVKRFQVEIIAKQYVQLYEEILTKN